MGLGKLDNYQFVVTNFSCAGFLLFKQPDHCLMISPVLYDALSAHTVQLLNDEELSTGRDRFWVNLALTIRIQICELKPSLKEHSKEKQAVKGIYASPETIKEDASDVTLP